jgi:UDP-N-acetylglucosamine 1-carboxyvinyltransferase
VHSSLEVGVCVKCVPLPGGCAIGHRIIDQHIKGLEALGGEVEIRDGFLTARAPHGLCSARIVFDKPTVGGTGNLLMAASSAQGSTTLVNAACDPEVIDLAKALGSMGVFIGGLGTREMTIEGSSTLHPYQHRVMPLGLSMVQLRDKKQA